MRISKFFEQIGAPLTNRRWSWGAERLDGTVVLRAWQDELKKLEGKSYFRLSNHAFFKGNEENLGYRKRLAHIKAIKSGAKCCYMVMCLVEDPKAHPRVIASYNEKYLFVGGEIREIDGDSWIEMVDRKPWRDLIAC